MAFLMIDEPMTEEVAEEVVDAPEAPETAVAPEESEEGSVVLPKSFFGGKECKAGDVLQIRVTGMDSDGDYTVERDDGGDAEPMEDIATGVKKAFETEPPSRDAMMALKKGRM